MLKGVDFVEQGLNLATKMMREEFDKMPNGIEKWGMISLLLELNTQQRCLRG